MRRLATLVTLTAVGVAGLVPIASSAQASPSATESYYVDTFDPMHWYNLGQQLGAADLARPGVQTRYVFLDFGDPAISGSTYGTISPGGGGTFHSRADLQQIPLKFAQGYFVGTGSDTGSTISLALGESNAGSQVVSNATQQGRAWANFVGTAINQITGATGQVGVTGAFDAELGYNNAANTLALINGYSGLYGYASTDFGDANGCSKTDRSDCMAKDTPTSPIYDWPIEQVYQKSAAPPYRVAFPEDYAQDGASAAQWANISRYAVNAHGGKINFAGTLSQYQACVERNDCVAKMTKNTPDAAWTFLYNALAASASTAMSPRFSDDIAYGGKS